MTTTIRPEQPSDYRQVETIHRNAFWNLYVPGADEHYLAHIIRNHADFVPELDLVLERNAQVIGNIMYTKAKLIDEAVVMRKRFSHLVRSPLIQPFNGKVSVSN
ncbi:MAG: hypothetical protein ACFWT8_05930 [Lacticaseibacillus casei]